jgi:hypothetical protein
VLVDDDFSAGIPPYWTQETPGGGNVSLVNGAARFTVFDTATSAQYQDAEINDGPPRWLYVSVDLRLRTSNNNRYRDVGAGAGSRGWGFWDGTFNDLVNNAFWFISFSPESYFNGYLAMSISNRADGVWQDARSDITQWHTYRLVWRPKDSEFYIDGTFVAAEPNAPSAPMWLVIWIDNIVLKDYYRRQGALDLPEEQFADLDWIRVYTSRARFNDGGGGTRRVTPWGAVSR